MRTKRTFPSKVPAPKEADEQAAVVAYLRARRIPYFAPINENIFGGIIRTLLIGTLGKARGLSVATRLISSIERAARRLGKVKGAPDLVVLAPHGRTLFIEMKRRKGSKVSVDQERFAAAAGRRGHIAAICYGSFEAIALIQRYETMKGESDGETTQR
jgi:hypothetical protein